jgi:hypothetical protein
MTGVAGRIVVTLSLSLLSSSLLAQDRSDAAKRTELSGPTTLQVDAPPDAACSGEEALRTAVEARLGKPVFSEVGSRADPPASTGEPAIRRVQVRFARAGTGFDATLSVIDEAGTRSGARQLHTDSPRCTDLNPALEFVIGTLIGVLPAAGAPEPAAASSLEVPPEELDEAGGSAREQNKDHAVEPHGSADPPSAALAQAAEPAASESAKPRYRVRLWRHGAASEPWRLGWVAGVVCEGGLLPGVALGAATGLQAVKGPLTLLAEGVGLPHATAKLGERASASFAGVFGRLAVCAGTGKLLGGRVSLCGGIRAGALFLRPQGLGVTQRPSPPPAVQAEIGLRYEGLRERRAGFYLGLKALLPIYAARPFYDAEGERHYYADPGPGLGGEFGFILRPRS